MRLFQKKDCPFCDQEVKKWFSREHEECRSKFSEEFINIKSSIILLINENRSVDFKYLINNTSQITQNYLQKGQGKKLIKYILQDLFITINSIERAKNVNDLTNSIAKYYEVSKEEFMESVNDDSILSENLRYAFDNLITPLLDDFLIDEEELQKLEEIFLVLRNIMPFSLAGLSNSTTAGIMYGNQLYRLKNNHELNEVSLPAGIMLQRNEQPIMSFNDVGCYSLNIKTKYRGRSTGGSYRISSRLTVRHSEHRGRPINYSEWDNIGKGKLVLTNKHIYFLGDGQARDHKEKINSIISFEPTSDGFIVNLNFKTRPAVRYKMDEHCAFYCTNMLSMAEK